MQATIKSNLTDSVRAYYDKLFQDGFLVSVHVSKWGMSTNLSKEDIEYNKKIPEIFRLGKKMLINPKHLNDFMKIESRARRYLDSNSYDFPAGDAHFVPKKKVVEVLTKLEDIRLEFNKLKDSFIEKYEEYKEEVLKDYPLQADSLRPCYPHKDLVGGKFSFSVSMYEIHMPKELSTVDIQTLIDRDQAKEEVKKKLEVQLENHYKESLVKLESFTEESAKLLRGQMVTMCHSVIDKIKKGEVVSKANIKSIREEIGNFRSLNFLDDKVVEQQINNLEKVVSGNVNYKTDKEALEELNTALVGVLEKANNLNDLDTLTGTYFRAIKL